MLVTCPWLTARNDSRVQARFPGHLTLVASRPPGELPRLKANGRDVVGMWEELEVPYRRNGKDSRLGWFRACEVVALAAISFWRIGRRIRRHQRASGSGHSRGGPLRKRIRCRGQQRHRPGSHPPPSNSSTSDTGTNRSRCSTPTSSGALENNDARDIRLRTHLFRVARF